MAFELLSLRARSQNGGHTCREWRLKLVISLAQSFPVSRGSCGWLPSSCGCFRASTRTYGLAIGNPREIIPTCLLGNYPFNVYYGKHSEKCYAHANRVPRYLFNYFNVRNICYSPAGRSVLGKTVPEVLDTARGRRPRAVSKTEGTVFPNTDRPSAGE